MPRFRIRAAGLAAVLVVAACGLADVVGSAGGKPVQIIFVVDSVLVIGDTVPFSVVVQSGSAALPRPQLQLTFSDTNIVAFTAARDSLVAKRHGSVWLSARVMSSLVPNPPPEAGESLHVVVAGVALDRSADTLWALGDSTRPFVVTQLNKQGNPAPGAPITWRLIDSTAAVARLDTLTGRVFARGNGPATVLVVVDQDTARAGIVVRQRLARFTLSPAGLFFASLNQTKQLVATARDASGNPIAGVGPLWESCNPNIAGVDTGGVVRALANGVTCVVASRDTIADSARVAVNQQASHIVITPNPVPPLIAVGDSLRLAATAVDSFGSAVLNGVPTFAVADTLGLVRVTSAGVVTGLAPGIDTVAALLDGAAARVTVTVRNDAASLVVSPDTTTIANLGDSLRLADTVRNHLGDLILGATPAWSSADSAVAGAAGVAGGVWVMARTTGTARIVASLDALADTTRVRVLNVPVQVAIVPDSLVLASLGDSLLLPEDIRNKRGDVLSRSSVTWTSDNTAVVRVTTGGRVIAQDTGSTVVRATSPFDASVADSVLVRSPNNPASVTLDVTIDTMTALGQQIGYTAVVRNARGNLIPAFPVTWTSSSAVATVSGTGVVTALGFGAAAVVAQAGAFVDSLHLVVRNPTLLYVDNGVVAAVRVGTLRRPFAQIQDGLTAADANDTVLVRRGASAYKQASLTRPVTLLGDSSEFLSHARDPLFLPLVSHDSGPAALLVRTAAPVLIKNLAIEEFVDGPAIDARHSVQIVNVFVNPVGTVSSRLGRGIAVDSSASATITGVTILNVRGYGVRLRDGTGSTVDQVLVHTVDSVPGEEPGAGIRLLRETGALVRRDTVRGTAGPAIEADSSPNVAVIGNDLAGRQQLAVIRWGNGAVVQSNAFDTRPLGLNGEVFDGGVRFEWAALLLQASGQHLVTGNTFRDSVGASASPMNAMRFVDVVASDPALLGAQVLNNQVLGGRDGVRLRRSKVLVQGTRIDSTLTGVHAVQRDWVALVGDTVRNALEGGCVRGDTTAALRITASRFTGCTVSWPYAIDVAGDTVSVLGSVFRLGRAAVRDSGGSSFTARGDSVSGAGFTPALGTTAALAGLQASAATVTIVGNTVTDHRLNAGVRVSRPGTVFIDSNLVARNISGMQFNGVTVGTFTTQFNDIVDNDVAGVVNEAVSGSPLNVENNWWGDGRGPRGGTNTAATGDSLSTKVNYPTAMQAAPLYPGDSLGAVAFRKVRGDGQSALRGSTLLQAFTARVVDANGRPVAGVWVTFTVTAGGGTFGLGGPTVVTVASDASGLAEATLTLDISPGLNTVTVSTPGLLAVTFTATGT